MPKFISHAFAIRYECFVCTVCFIFMIYFTIKLISFAHIIMFIIQFCKLFMYEVNSNIWWTCSWLGAMTYLSSLYESCDVIHIVTQIMLFQYTDILIPCGVISHLGLSRPSKSYDVYVIIYFVSFFFHLDACSLIVQSLIKITRFNKLSILKFWLYYVTLY